MTKGFYQCLKDKIRTDLPDWKSVELFRGQDQSLEQRDQKPLTYPAALIEFQVDEVMNLAAGVKDYLMRVRFRLMFEGYSNDREFVLDMVDQFKCALDRFRGGDDSEEKFTSFDELPFVPDLDFENLQQIIIEYQTKYRYLVTHKNRFKTTETALEADIQAVISTNIFTAAFAETFK
jgi:hypothetical protein